MISLLLGSTDTNSSLNTGSQRIRLLAENAKQLFNALKETYPNHNYEDNTLPASCYGDSPRGPDGALCAWAQAQELLRQYGAEATDDIYVQTEIESGLLRFLRSSQEVMSGAASNYDLRHLSLGICITGLAVLFSIPATYKALSNHTLPRLFLVTGVLLYGAMMFASSYVEEEQQFWYWVFTGWTFYLHVRSIRLQKAPRGAAYLLPAAILAISHRFMRRWNQTGQKFAAEPDIARIYLPSHRINLWLLIVVTYADVCLHLMDDFSSLIWRLLCLAVTAMCFTFKLVFAASESPELLNETTIQAVATFMDGITLVLYARVAMGGIALLFMLIFMRNGKLPIKQGKQAKLATNRISDGTVGLFHEALTLFLLTQSRVTNVPIFLFFRLQLKALTWMNLNSVEITLTSLLMQYIAFFAFGGSNAISSIDLSNAYNGVGVYNVILVGILTYVGNWAGPIWWISATKLLRTGQSHDEIRTHIALLTFHAASILTSVMAACTALRTHLFIWTVFSPKYLYTMSWVIIHHWVNLLLPTVGRQ